MTDESSHPLGRWLGELLPDTTAAEAIGKSLRDAPGRIDEAYRELLGGYAESPAAILASGTRDAPDRPAGDALIVESRDIPFMSLCVHHFLPFFGSVAVVYVPGAHLPGLGKVNRLVACHARRLQVQELMARSVAKDLVAHAGVQSVRVDVVATHTCVCYRGPRARGTVNHTRYTIGDVDSPALA